MITNKLLGSKSAINEVITSKWFHKIDFSCLTPLLNPAGL